MLQIKLYKPILNILFFLILTVDYLVAKTLMGTGHHHHRRRHVNQHAFVQFNKINTEIL